MRIMGYISLFALISTLVEDMYKFKKDKFDSQSFLLSNWTDVTMNLTELNMIPNY